MGQGLQRAFAATARPTEGQVKFLYTLARWSGAATPQEIGPQISQADNSLRQTCKRRGWVRFEGGYWRLTQLGKEVEQRWRQ